MGLAIRRDEMFRLIGSVLALSKSSAGINLKNMLIRKLLILVVPVVCVLSFPVRAEVADTRNHDLDIGGLLRVEVATAQEILMRVRGTNTGVVHAWRAATVAAEVPGRIVERHIEPGYEAKRGETLLVVDQERLRASLRQAEAAYNIRAVDLADTQTKLERSRELLEKKHISQDVVDDQRFAVDRATAALAAAKAQHDDSRYVLEDATIRAPFDGKIEAVHAQLGDYVRTGDPIATITDFSRARIITGIPSSSISLIALNDYAEVGFSDLGGVRLEARVTNVGSIKDRIAGTFPVELELDTQDVKGLRDGLVGTIAWAADDNNVPTLAVPVAALVRRQGSVTVFVALDGRVVSRPVRTRRNDGIMVEVVDGLAAGERVVVSGHFALQSGSRIEIFEGDQS